MPDEKTTLVGAALAVPGVRDAAAVVDRRLRRSGTTASGAAEPVPAAVTATPVPADRPALVVGPPPVVPAGAPTTLVEALRRAATMTPDRGTTYVLRDGGTDRQTYAELLADGLRLLTGLRDLGLRPGDPVLVQCADSRSFVTGFWACVLGGFLPTPVGPAPDYHGDNAVTRKLKAAWELLDRPPVLTDTALRDPVRGLAASWDRTGEPVVASVAELTSATAATAIVPSPDTPVLNLLTSGSTGTPKCVHHTNSSIVARTFATAVANGFTADEVSLNWMPLDHVGGIVMFNVRDVFLRCEHVNALTEAFVRRPVSWLDWIERFGATNTWAPNFAFALVNKHAGDIAAGRWDLSSMRNICNAGEAVVAGTAHRFLDLLTPHGLPADAMVPCWGMSETSSGVTYSRLTQDDPAVGTVSLDPSSLTGQLATVAPGTPRSVVLTEVGTPIAGVSLRIVDDAGAVLPEGRVGRLHVTGTTIMREYFRNPAANEAFQPDGWFDTGDLGFVRDGRLTLTGRLSDMVIVNGANYPVHEVEAVVEQVPGVLPTCAAVCGVPDEDTGTDAVLVFFVPDDDGAADLDATVARVRATLARDFALRPRTIVPVTAAEFPRTASGKIQRNRLTEAFALGRFAERGHDLTEGRAPTTDSLLDRVWCPAESDGEQALDAPVLVYGTVPGLDAAAVIRPGAGFRVVEPDVVEIDPLDREQHDRALAYFTGRIGTPASVVYALEIGAPEPLAPQRFLATLQALAQAAPKVALTVLTRGASGAPGSAEVVPERAALTAMVRTAAAEATVGSVRLIDVAGDPDLARVVRTNHDSDLVAITGGTACTPRLRLVDRSPALGVPARFLPPDGTVLVTGGLGGLGRTVTEHLLAVGARVLVVGRTPDPDLGDLPGLGDLRYAAVDVADAVALRAAVEDAERAWSRPLDLVLHLAGTAVAPQWTDLAAHELRHEDPGWLATMLRPKLGGCAAIEQVLADRPATAVVLFSSVNGFLGGSAFGAYAAANAAVDGYALRWAARGRTVRCVGWSMWAGDGMNDGSPLTPAARRRGLSLIEPEHGLGLLFAALHQERPYVLAGVDAANPHVQPHLAADQFAGGSTLIAVALADAADEAETVRAVAAAIARTGELAQVVVLPHVPRDAAGAVDLSVVLAARTGSAARFVAPDGPVESAIAAILRKVLGVPEIGRDDSFFALGGDSIRVLQVLGGVTEEFGHDLPVSALYEHPTVRELAEALGAQATAR